MDVAVYNTRVMGPAHVENVADLACRTALARRGVAHINFPVDFQSLKRRGPQRAERRRATPTRRCSAAAVGAARPRTTARPPRSSTPARRSPSWPAAARSGATDELEQVGGHARRADHQGAARQGRACPTTAPTPPAASACSAPGRRRRHRGVRHAAHGRPSFPYIEFLPKPGQARGVQIDIDPDAHRPALSRSRSAWWATARRRSQALLPLLRTQRGPRVPRSRRRRG